MDQALHETVTTWRRHLHAHPELSLHETATAAFVCARLAELGIPFVAGVGGHGVVATLARGGGNRSVGLRADMDALPIMEETGLAYASANPGVMHACGHDGHTASLLGAAILLQRDPNWRGTIQLVFQPAEEGLGGAKAMIADGLFSRFPMERIFGYHNWPGLAAGTVMLHDGPVLAAGSRFAITIEGKGAHAAMPHLAGDALLAAAQIVVALQSVVSRAVDPLESGVISVCTMAAGTASNQIASSAVLRGTMRALTLPVIEIMEDGMRRVVAGVASAMGVTAEAAISRTVGVTVNARAEAALAAEAASGAGLAVRRDMAPSMASEDFSYLLAECPGAFAWIGNGEVAAHGALHNPGYDYNDAILPAASTYLASVARAALRE